MTGAVRHALRVAALVALCYQHMFFYSPFMLLGLSPHSLG